MNTERTARVHAHSGVVALALLAAFAMAPRLEAQQNWPDEAFDLNVFQQDSTAAAARVRLNSELSTKVNEIDQACRLTDVQKKKLQLAGRGDIQRFFGNYETAKEKFQLARDKFSEVHAQPGEKVADRLQQAQLNEVMIVRMQQELLHGTLPLRTALQAGLFHEGSLLYKSLRRTLTNEQLARFEALEAQRRAARHRASIESTIAQLTRGAPLPEAQRRDLIRLLADEIKPARKAAASPYDWYYVLYMMSRVPEEKLKPLFDATQWAALSRQLNQYGRMEAALRQKGMLPDEDDDDAKPLPARPAVQKK